ncbi:predicted protein, partial [Nematostella vectensis]
MGETCTGLYAVMLRRRLRMTRNWLILSLATADLLIGLFVIPCYYLCNFHVTCNWSVLIAVYNFLLYASVTNVCLITADRFIAVVHPYRYASLMATSSVHALTAVAWVLPMVVCLIPI